MGDRDHCRRRGGDAVAGLPARSYYRTRRRPGGALADKAGPEWDRRGDPRPDRAVTEAQRPPDGDARPDGHHRPCRATRPEDSFDRGFKLGRALEATEHLLDLGHSRVGTITGPPSMLCSRARLGGYRAAVESAGIELDPSLVVEGNFHFEPALAAALAMLSLEEPPTAIFAASDVQAMGVYEAARQKGLRIPDDLSVIGFDDVPVARWVPPPLTTLRQPLVEMASLAVRILLDPEFAARHPRLELATSLVLRSSTAPPRTARRSAAVSGRGRAPRVPHPSRKGRTVKFFQFRLARGAGFFQV